MIKTADGILKAVVYGVSAVVNLATAIAGFTVVRSGQ
jgi:hypothetical protein